MVPSTLEIATRAKPRQIFDIATKAGIRLDEVEAYGNFKAKVSLRVLERLSARPNGKLICVTGMTPTREGDGKTCTSVGLTQALGILKKKVFLCLREPSLAPIFGFKGGATGGGYSQVVPMEDINLHFTGDIHAIEIAHNLLAAVLENHIHHGNHLKINKDHIFWRRTLDISDRQLREIVVGLSKATHFPKYRTGFDITAASEVMAVLSLSNSIHSFKNKLSKISVALSDEGRLITAKDLKSVGAMALLMKDALKPNLVQTLEGQPVFIHTGPFANVSHGNSSLLATQTALKLANYVVTESGFAADLGLEKLFDIVCRESGIKPSVVVIVISLKALKSHAPKMPARRGPDMFKAWEVFKEGFANARRHIDNIRKFGVEPVVAINRFPDEDEEELRVVKDYFQSIPVECAVSDVVKSGGKGGIELAEKVLKVITEKPASFRHFYELSLSAEEKIEKLAKDLYGASGVTYLEGAREDLERVHRLKLDHLPVNIAKTPYSFSDNAELKGAPSGWKLAVRAIRPYTGAGFLVVLSGKMMLMPGLPSKPMLEEMDLLDDGRVKGLF
ncbi:MAG: formate--tetrahydrofolate ligase [Candidatus Omnitrophica bacterium]|nr:formate--tetrahydrofolate ligase [Candidatus Omnitrophota bacterium]